MEVHELAPRKLEEFVFITQVSAGELHTAYLCKDGCVFTSGWGGEGRLGHGDEQWQLYPMKVVDSFATGLHVRYVFTPPIFV